MKNMNQTDIDTLLNTLKTRFEFNMNRHPHITWTRILERIQLNKPLLQTIFWMEDSGGEPDVVEFKSENLGLVFVDCSVQSPAKRRSLCYDQVALDSRAKNKPLGNALTMAQEMGVVLLNEGIYRELQNIEPLDTKTSSWLVTPSTIRSQGGAIFGDYRYGSVFVYHNGADSYYAARGFRAYVKI